MNKDPETVIKFIRCSGCGQRFRLKESECPYICACGREVSIDGVVLAPALANTAPTVPGTELRKLFDSIGITPHIGCRCKEVMSNMDVWGPDGCREHFSEIVTSLEEDAKKYSWRQHVRAARKAVLTDLVFKVNPFNPMPDFVLEAIRRAEEKSSSQCSLS